jgi:hypothetical protein
LEKKMTDFPENLGVRARRAALLPGEQAEFERVLSASPILRMAHQLGRDFDAIAAVEAGDEQRVARFVDRALAARRPKRKRLFGPVRLSPWMAAAAVLAVCGVALGVRGVWWPHPTTTPVASAAVAASAPEQVKHRAVSLPRPVSEATDQSSAATTQSNQNVIEPSVSLPSASQVVPLHSARVPVIRPSLQVVPTPTLAPVMTAAPQRKDSVASFVLEQPSELSAGALMRQASRARSLGEIDRAVALLSELQNEFSGTPEAHVSLVSLGKLLMQCGKPNAALQRFSSYLATSGPLEEEALVGRARSLAALGRASEERSTWQRLLARFPGSIYAGAARDRMVTLGQATIE